MASRLSSIRGIAIIVLVVTAATGSFAAAAGWLSPDRLTPAKIVDALAPRGGPALGYRRNHARGVCFTGVFDASGAAHNLSRAALFAAGRYPVIGRFSLKSSDPTAADANSRVRGMAFQIKGPGGSEWRSAMIIAPVFPVSSVRAFFDLQLASASSDPGALPAFVAAHPEYAPFGNWARSAPWTRSYAQDQFYGLNAFRALGPDGTITAVRWSAVPTVAIDPIQPNELTQSGPDTLAEELQARLAAGPIRYTLRFTVAAPGDPTADPSKQWPPERATVDAGTLVVQRAEAEVDGPCRDLNFDPTVLPDGLATGDDPFPAARSAAYAVSFRRRESEAAAYPRTTPRDGARRADASRE